jgi:peptidoglycan/LPS O-acetylase OafA/YrhL
LNVFEKLASGQTIAERIAEKKITTGFDYLRITLAAAVVLWHTVATSYGLAAQQPFVHSPMRPLMFAILPMFFALSGYLVTGSLLRAKTIFEFVMLRVLRIVPALFVEIFLSAFLLGGLFLTTVPKSTYFTSPEFYAYFLNVVGDIHYYLPGVFETNPLPGVVNGQLWTIPWELQCYFAITCAAIGWWLWRLVSRDQSATISNQRTTFLALAIIANIAGWAYFVTHKHHQLVDIQANGVLLVIEFLAGVTLYLFRDKIRLNVWLFVMAIAFTYVVTLDLRTEYAAAFPLAYVMVYLGMTSPDKRWLFGGADFSYGLYLFGFPIQQTYSYLFPGYRIWWLNFIFAMAFGLAYAAFSWFCVEKPINDRKKIIIAAVSNLLRVRPASALTTAKSD